MAVEAGASNMPTSLAALFPKPKLGDVGYIPEKAIESVPTVKIHCAVLGLIDVTDQVRSWINTSENSISFQASSIKRLADTLENVTLKDYYLSLAFVYQFSGHPMRICAARSEQTSAAGTNDNTKQYHITADSIDDKVVEPSVWNQDTWSVVGVVYGAKFYDRTVQDRVVELIKTNHNSGKGTRSCDIDDTFVKVSVYASIRSYLSQTRVDH